MNLDLADFIIGCSTLVVAALSAILTFRLQKEKKRVQHLEKHFEISLNNLEACYFLEKEFYAQNMELSHRELQNEVREWLKGHNMELYRKNMSPSYFQEERVYLS